MCISQSCLFSSVVFLIFITLESKITLKYAVYSTNHRTGKPIYLILNYLLKSVPSLCIDADIVLSNEVQTSAT